MANPWFDFKQFRIRQDRTPMRVTTDAVLLGSWVPVDGVSAVLDIGTGTGLLALMLAQRTTTRVEAVEIDPAACLQARENADQSPWKERIIIHPLSLQQFIREPRNPYDLIVSNPPYFRGSQKPGEPRKHLSRHDSSLSLEDLLEGVDHLLTPGGRFCLVLPSERGDECVKHAQPYGLYCHRSLAVIPRAGQKARRVLLELARSRRETEHSSLTILDGERNYTLEYRELTREFYLAF